MAGKGRAVVVASAAADGGWPPDGRFLVGSRLMELFWNYTRGLALKTSRQLLLRKLI